MTQKWHKSLHVLLPEHPLQALRSPACGCSPVASLQDWCRAAPWTPAHKPWAWIHKTDIKNKARKNRVVHAYIQYLKSERFRRNRWAQSNGQSQSKSISLSVTAECVTGLGGTASLLAAVGVNKQQQLTARSHKQQFTPSSTKSGFCYDSLAQAAGACHLLQAFPSWLWCSEQG